jgi:hypothetical protein
MSKSIQDALDLPTLENLLRTSAPGPDDMSTDPEINEDGEVIESPQNELSAQVGNALATNPLIGIDHEAKEARDHEVSMDKMYDETIQHSRDLMDLGYNVDTRSAGRIFETAATMYKLALDSKNSKRKAQLDLLKIQQEQQKIDIVKNNKGGGDGNGPIDTGSVIIEDRNELLRQLRDQSNK